MIFRVARNLLFAALLFPLAFFSDAVLAQRPTPAPGPGTAGRSSPGSSAIGGADPTIDIDVYVRGADGGPIEVTAVVSLVAPTGQVISQGSTLGGNIEFSGVAATEYKIEVAAPGYEKTVREFDGYNGGKTRIDIEMRADASGEKGAGSSQILLAPKAQKELGKALEALRANKPEVARSHLEEAYRRAPNHPAVNYLYGVYFFQMKDEEKAKSYWSKTLEFNPHHVSALLSLSEALVREQKLQDAESYVKRAVEADPNSWRGHAILADVLLKESHPNEAVKEADRALEIGQGQAAMVQPLLVRGLAESGNKARALVVLRGYVERHPNDAAARKQLESLEAPEGAAPSNGAPGAESKVTIASEAAIPVPLPSNPRRRGEDTPSETEFAPTSAKAQQRAELALDKAFEVLRISQTAAGAAAARSNLETAYKLAPNSADVNYLFGVYSWQTYDRARAVSYWRKAIESKPKHFRGLLSLGQALVDENRPTEALPYLERAAEADPFSWRPYALSAHAYLRQGSADQAAKQAERALELGHEEAAVARKYLAAALAERGERDKALRILETYVRDHHEDSDAKNQLARLKGSSGEKAPDAAVASGEKLLQSDAVLSITPFPLTTTRWLPADVDETVPPVEAGAACALDEAVQKVGQRVEEFVKNVDRFTASEFMEHESFDRGGFVKREETRKSDYLVSIEQYKAGYFSVLEYRGKGYSEAGLPDGVETNGLPALALIFHPKNAGNFAMSCEGLGEWNGRPAWQIHFRQRPDKPNTIRAYKFGDNGQTYPVAIKGRAWIMADNYQIVRLETDLVAALPEIRLVADHALVDYGPVRFKNRNLELWLPQSAEVYSDWRGKRIYRHLSYSNYLLFSVDEKQKISEPKAESEGQREN